MFSMALSSRADDVNLASLKSLSFEQLLKVNIPTVYGASKHDQKITEAPSDVTIITREEIQKFGYRTLAEILRSVRDFYVTYDRDYGYIGVRGFNRPGDFGGRILLLVDGHRLNEPIFDSAFNMTDFILDVDVIERVEIIRGPGSSLYGDNAFFAVINVITRKAADVKGLEVSGAGGSFESFKERVTFGHVFSSGLEVFMTGSLLQSEGNRRLYYKEFNQPENNYGTAEDLDGDHSLSGLTTVSYKEFTLQAAYVRRVKDIPTASYGVAFDDPRSHSLDERGYVNLSYAHEFDGGWNLKTNVYFDSYRYSEDYPNDIANPGDPRDIVVNRDQDDAKWWGAQLQLTRRFFSSHLVTLGADYRDDFRLSQRNFDVQPATTYLNVTNGFANYGVFLQDEWSVVKHFMLNAGVRYDYFTTVGGTVNPRAALIYSPTDKTTLKFIYGQAFRAPNAYEFFYAAPTQERNPGLKPEHIQSYELELEQTITKGLLLTADVFYNRVKDLISEETIPSNGLLTYRNIDNTETKGLSLELDDAWANGIKARLSYTLQRTTDTDTGQTLSDSPGHMAKFNLILPLYKDKISTGLEVQYTSSVSTLADNTAHGYAIVNWTLFAHELIRRCEMSASLYNLFNSRYGFPGAEEHRQDVIRQDGRTFRLELTYRF